MRKIPISIIILTLIAGCTGQKNKQESTGQTAWGNIELVMATLYNNMAAEYDALSYQAYNIASERISMIAAEKGETGSMAIVVDIDETILDNSPYQAKTIESGSSYPAWWDEWCNLAQAETVPGAVEFLSLADSLGFAIFYVSNRKSATVYDATFENLATMGFPQVNDQTMMLRETASESNPNPSDKESRRQKIESMGYTIVLLAGDNLGDFFVDEAGSDARSEQVERLKEQFGTRFIVLPNAMYGNWPASLGIDGNPESWKSLIMEMTLPFNNIEE